MLFGCWISLWELPRAHVSQHFCLPMGLTSPLLPSKLPQTLLQGFLIRFQCLAVSVYLSLTQALDRASHRTVMLASLLQAQHSNSKRTSEVTIPDLKLYLKERVILYSDTLDPMHRDLDDIPYLSYLDIPLCKC